MTNLEHLETLDPRFRPKAEAVLKDLEGKGWVPRIVSSRRTKAEQAEKVRAGYSKTMKSKHVDGLAIDVVDSREGYNSPSQYWLHVGSSAIAHGLRWGGFFGLDAKQKERLTASIVSRTFDLQLKRGWDPSHVEMIVE